MASNAPSETPEVTAVRAGIYAAAGILGSLYAEVSASARAEEFNPDQLRALALRVSREGMRAARRLKKAADSR